jgi:hypothetical protein
MQKRIRGATETRGFAQSRVLTHWAEIVGEATAKIAHPVDVGYTRGGMGATLTVLTGTVRTLVDRRLGAAPQVLTHGPVDLVFGAVALGHSILFSTIRPGIPSIGNAISTAVHASSVINPASGEPETWKAALIATQVPGVKPW